MLQFLEWNINKELNINSLKNMENEFKYFDLEDGYEDFIYLKPVTLLDEDFSIFFSFNNNILQNITLHSRKLKYYEADNLHREWLEKNFSQYRRWIGKELHYITDEYDFYADYDPRSGSAEIWCKVLK